MSGPSRRFDPAEIRDVDGGPLPDAEAAAMLGMARDLEEFARAESIVPSVGFEDRVMAAVAAEAPPRPVAAGGFLAGLVVAVRDSWRIAFSSGRPMAVRAQALALVLLVVVATGSVGTLAAAGVARLLSDGPTPSPTVDESPEPTSEPGPSEPVPTPSPSLTPSPTLTPSPSPSETAEPSETPEATEGSSGGSTAAPTKRPTAEPSETPEATHDDETETPHPSDTAEPDETDDPDDTPDPDD